MHTLYNGERVVCLLDAYVSTAIVKWGTEMNTQQTSSLALSLHPIHRVVTYHLRTQLSDVVIKRSLGGATDIFTTVTLSLSFHPHPYIGLSCSPTNSCRKDELFSHIPFLTSLYPAFPFLSRFPYFHTSEIWATL